jgi:hypothetical protein
VIDWLRSLSWAMVAFASPIAGAMAIATGVKVPDFARVLGRRNTAPIEPVAFALGALLMVLVVLAVQAALGLVFNPRYRDFPFTALTGAVVPFVALMTAAPTRKDIRANAETVAAAMLALCAVYIALSETFANWQSLWFCGALALLALSLLPGRAAPAQG